MKARSSKNDIVAHSFDHVWVHGYNNTSIKDVVEKAGILKGSFYNYFNSKDDFIGAVLDAYTAEWARGVSKHLLDRSAPPPERLHRLFAEYKEMFRSGMGYSRGCLAGNLGQELGGIHEKIGRQVESAFVRIEKIYKSCLDDALASGHLAAGTDTRRLASFLLNSLEGAFLRAKSAGTVEPLDAFEDVVFGMILRE